MHVTCLCSNANAFENVALAFALKCSVICVRHYWPIRVIDPPNNVEREGTTAIVRKYRQLVRTLKQTRVEQVILSGILPVMGRRGHKFRNCRGMAINMLVQKLCREEKFGFVDLWGSFVGRADMYMKDGLNLSGKGAAE